MAQSSSLKDRVAGKGQLPQYLLDSLVLSTSRYRSRPDPRRVGISQAIEQRDVAIDCNERSLQAIPAYRLHGSAVVGPDRLEEASG